jgi:hypothetical protein
VGNTWLLRYEICFRLCPLTASVALQLQVVLNKARFRKQKTGPLLLVNNQIMEEWQRIPQTPKGMVLCPAGLQSFSPANYGNLPRSTTESGEFFRVVPETALGTGRRDLSCANPTTSADFAEPGEAMERSPSRQGREIEKKTPDGKSGRNSTPI